MRHGGLNIVAIGGGTGLSTLLRGLKEGAEPGEELLVADQPARKTSHDPASKFWNWAEKIEVTKSRFPAAERWPSDITSHIGRPRESKV